MNEARALLVRRHRRRFAREGYIACVMRRTADKLGPLGQQIRAEGGQAHGFGSDARKEEEMVALVAKIEREIAPIEVAVFHTISPTPTGRSTSSRASWPAASTPSA